jgi:hypothetical protein
MQGKPMGLLKRALRTGIALKLLDMARQEAAKPANQAKAKALLAKVTSSLGGTTPRR